MGLPWNMGFQWVPLEDFHIHHLPLVESPMSHEAFSVASIRFRSLRGQVVNGVAGVKKGMKYYSVIGEL